MNWKNSIPDYIMAYKPPDAAQSFNQSSALRFSARSPCDYMMFNGFTGLFYTLELKSSSGAFSFERKKEDKGMIRLHQIESLKKFATFQSICSGFILDFRKSDNTYFLSIADFLLLIKQIDKKSFNEMDLLQYCLPIYICKRKLKVNYRYDIEKFLEDTAHEKTQKEAFI